MFFFRRRSASKSIPTSNRPASIEGLEGRRLLSAAVVHADTAGHSTPGVHSHLSNLHVGGTVVGVDTTADTLTISTGGAAGSTSQTTYNVASTAAITANGAAVTLGQLVAGVKVVLTVSSSDPTTATAIKAIATKVSGVASAVDATAGTISLTTRRGAAATTYTIPADATITVNHVAGTLADITVGSTVHLQFSALSGTTVASVASHSKPSASLISNSTPTSTPTTSGAATVPGGSSSSSSSSTVATTGGSTSSSSTGSSTGSTSTGATSTGSTSSDPTSGTSSTPVGSTDTGGSNSTNTSSGGSGFGWGGIGQQFNFGTLVSVDTTAGTITLSNPFDGSASSSTTTYTLGAGATITADGATATLGALSVGDDILLTLGSTTPTTVTSVKAIGKSLDGSVTAVDTTADTITLTPEDGGASTTVTIPSAATITVDGTAGTLAGITTGSQVHVQYSALDNTTIIGVSDFSLPSGLGGGMGGHRSDDSAFGTLVSVDTTADTITLSSDGLNSSTPTQTTYTLGSAATITADGATATLGALAVGDRIVLSLTSTTPATVTTVKATGESLDGQVTAVDTTADTITLTPNDGSASTTVTIPSAATITVDGSTGTLAGVTTGSQVHIQYSALDSTTVISVSDFSLPSGFGGGSGGDHHQNDTAFGTLVSVDTTANTITLSNNGLNSSTPTQTTYTLGSGATITADGATATLGGLAVGDQIVLSLTSTTPATVTAIKATGMSLDGKVTAVDTTAGTITLTPDDGSASTTVTIPSGATISVNGATGTLAGVTTGSQVHIQYSALDSTTIISVNDFSLPTGLGGGGFGGNQHNNNSAFGTLVSVDTTANTITLSSSSWDSSTPTQTTYTLGAGATITADGATATLGGLAVGDQISLSLSSTTPATVTSIKATGMSLDGQVTAVDTTANTITLTPDDGSASTTVTIPSGATITVNGTAGTLAGVTTGAQVHIQYSALDSTQIISVGAFTAPAGWGGFGGGGNGGGGGGFGGGGFSNSGGNGNSGGISGIAGFGIGL